MGQEGDKWQDDWVASNQHLHEKFRPLLSQLKEGSKVAVITMTGSCCPITKAHVMAFEVARDFLIAKEAEEEFQEVLGILCLNSDNHVWWKLSQIGQEMIDWSNRIMLASLATEQIWWAGVSYIKERWAVQDFKEVWPSLKFIQYHMNGADDVLKYQKWTWAVEDERYITMGRPGFTEELKSLAPETKLFLIGPELPEISSSQVRAALREEDNDALDRFLHPAVKSWCLRHSPYGPPRRRTAGPVKRPKMAFRRAVAKGRERKKANKVCDGNPN